MFGKNKSAELPPQIDFDGKPIGPETIPVNPEKVKKTGDFLGRIADLGVTVSDSARPFLEDPRTRDAASRVADAAVAGATDQFRGGDGRVKKRKVLGAALRPTRTARRATTGAGIGAFREGRGAAEDVARGAVAGAFGGGGGELTPTPALNLSESFWGSSPSDPWETTPARTPIDPFAESAPPPPTSF